MKLSFEQKGRRADIRTDADGAALLGLLIRGCRGCAAARRVRRRAGAADCPSTRPPN